MSNRVKITLGTFVGIAMALIASVRSVPQLAATGWQMIVYMIIAVLFFALPLALLVGVRNRAGQRGFRLTQRSAVGAELPVQISFLGPLSVSPRTK